MRMAAVFKAALVLLMAVSATTAEGGLGIFSNSADIGGPQKKGSTRFIDGEYRMSGSGANVWGKRDEFQYAWREAKGNFSMSATLRFLGQGVEHRKAGIMVRQSTEANDTYADVVIHGSGMAALQWRSKQDDETNTFDLNPGPQDSYRIKLVRTGVKIYLYLAKNAQPLAKVANTEVTFHDPVLVGLAVCAHQSDGVTDVVFSDVTFESENPK